MATNFGWCYGLIRNEVNETDWNISIDPPQKMFQQQSYSTSVNYGSPGFSQPPQSPILPGAPPFGTLSASAAPASPFSSPYGLYQQQSFTSPQQLFQSPHYGAGITGITGRQFAGGSPGGSEPMALGSPPQSLIGSPPKVLPPYLMGVQQQPTFSSPVLVRRFLTQIAPALLAF